MRLLRTILIVFLLLLSLLVAYFLIFNLTDPAVDITAARQPNGTCLLEIRPNFVINRILSISVSSPSGILLHTEPNSPSRQRISLPTSIPVGTPITVTCEIQYDRTIAACKGSTTNALTLP